MKKLNIRITTQSGSVYELTHKDGKFLIQKGISLSGEVVRLREPIQVGGVLHLDFVRNGMYGTPDSDPMFLRTSPITDIVIR